MSQIPRTVLENRAKDHIFSRHILSGRYILGGHYLEGADLAWKCAGCGGRLEVDPANLQELLISTCLSEQCTPGLDVDSMKKVRIP